MQTNGKTYSSAIETASNYTAWLADLARPYIGNDILEIGFGHDSLSAALGPFGSYLGVDIDAEAVDEARRQSPDRDFAVGDIAASDFLEALGGRRFDTVLCYNVLEHVFDDRLALGNLMSVLRPGGYMVVFVPAHMALYGDLDRLAGHERRYERGELGDKVAGLGEIADLEYVNPLGGFGWWLNTFKKHDNLDSDVVNRQIRLFDRYGVPVSRLLSSVFNRLFGQSLICVVKK